MVTSTKTRNLVLLQEKEEVKTEWGKDVSWKTLHPVWVSITPNRGREDFDGDEKKSVVTHIVRGDYLELQKAGDEMRFVYNVKHCYSPEIDPNSIVLDILAVMPDFDEHGDIMIKCEQNPLKFSKISSNIAQ